jgi:glycosyltransferase involved in cell wall biosynthesis
VPEPARLVDSPSRAIQHEFVVAMLGARMHYATPRILHESGRLLHLFTDLCGVKGVPRTLAFLPKKVLPSSAQRVLERIPKSIPRGKITAFTGFGIRYALHIARARSPGQLANAFLWGGQEFCRLVRTKWPDKAGALFAYNSAALELLCHAKEMGVYGVVEQTIAPKKIERQLLSEEESAYPGWEALTDAEETNEEYMAREEAEWRRADLIVCGSQFVKEAIGNCGGPTEKVSVVPYGVDIAPGIHGRERAHQPLHVLTVGAVGLRKGSPYVLNAARTLRGQAVFRIVGDLSIAPSAERTLRKDVELTGRVTRGQVSRHYAWADVFLLPSVCEGSATACYEALGWGLPVITTPNAGSPVRDGVDGFVVPVRDSEAIAERLTRLCSAPDLLAAMSRNALERSREFSVQLYGERLLLTLDTERLREG